MVPVRFGCDVSSWNYGWARRGNLTRDGDAWRYTNYKTGEKGDLKVMLISSIPYENIEHVDWEGDEYYGYPHIYGWFNNKKALRAHWNFDEE